MRHPPHVCVGPPSSGAPPDRPDLHFMWRGIRRAGVHLGDIVMPYRCMGKTVSVVRDSAAMGIGLNSMKNRRSCITAALMACAWNPPIFTSNR